MATSVVERCDIVSIEHATHILKASRPYVIARLLRGELRGERIGRQYFVNRDDVEQLAAARNGGAA